MDAGSAAIFCPLRKRERFSDKKRCDIKFHA